MNLKQGASVVRTDKRNRKKPQQKTELQCRSLINENIYKHHMLLCFYLSPSSLFVWFVFVFFFWHSDVMKCILYTSDGCKTVC